MQEQHLQVTEIYASIQGESSYSGFPCTFIRLTGCPLRCRWCDTVYSFNGGKQMSIEQVVDDVQKLGINLVELTGGEPLAQALTIPLIAALEARGHKILIETSGSEPIEHLSAKTHIIMDLKPPGSGMADKNRWENLGHLKPTDEVKFVMANRDDYDWARKMISDNRLGERVQILYSCAFGLLQPKDLVDWLVADRLPGRMQLQIHKYIWHPRAKGV
jgi:7-carboxy-7-deazaguanine synthase